MIEQYDRFGLVINDQVVRTPIAIASMAGVVDAGYVLKRAAHVGAAFLGGYSIDGPTIEASRMMSAEGRCEFLFENPIEEIKKQVSQLKTPGLVIGANMRASSPDALVTAADELGDSVVYEIDAHCRQQPMMAAGGGEFLVKNPKELLAMVRAMKTFDITLSVKFRAGVADDDRQLARKLWQAGADILHIDLMDFGHTKLRQIRNICPAVIIANNSINNFDRMKEMFSHGADLVSLARKSDERTLAGLDAAITRFADEHGWYNAPKQLCRGGDIRALAFCCMPVKNCPLIPTLEKIGIPREEYIRLKEAGVTGTPLEGGKNTCFGSLAWCCKDSSPCMFREMTLAQEGLSSREYMTYKHDLSERIMHHIFHERKPADQERACAARDDA